MGLFSALFGKKANPNFDSQGNLILDDVAKDLVENHGLSVWDDNSFGLRRIYFGAYALEYFGLKKTGRGKTAVCSYKDKSISNDEFMLVSSWARKSFYDCLKHKVCVDFRFDDYQSGIPLDKIPREWSEDLDPYSFKNLGLYK